MPTKEILTIHTPVIKGSKLICTYSTGSEEFECNYAFPDTLVSEGARIEKLLQWVAVTTSLGLFSVDYFEELKTDFNLSSQEVEFFEKLIFLGLGEFRYTNKIPISTKTRFLGEHQKLVSDTKVRAKTKHLKPLLLNGGGKDGSVSAMLLSESAIDFTWFNRGISMAQQNVIQAWDAPSLTIIRNLDPKRENRKYSGHRPMSAGIATVALLTAEIYGYTDVIASNELSANEGNFELDGFKINHQYSKSAEFEKDLQFLLQLFDIRVRYFSLLRPLHELQIAFLAKDLNDTQLRAITSCNNGTKQGKWCLKCAKCAFVVLVITAASPAIAATIWGNNAISKPGIQHFLIQLLDPDVDKPLECVGTLEECQIAAYMILEKKDVELNPGTRKMLGRFAIEPNKSFFTELGDSLVPQDCAGVISKMKEKLASYSAQQ